MRLRHILAFVCLSLFGFARLCAQSPNGTISGLVVDPTEAIVVGADVLAANDATGVQYSAKTNQDGIYLVSNLPPGTYRLQVSKVGFKVLIKPDIVLNVQDALAINFTLPVGAISEIVTVTAGAPLINTQDAAVSTVVDRQFAENLPMNGRSFQTLIDLTPGVTLTASTGVDPGQFSANGQRTDSNYWMVDGVSANAGSSALFGGSGLAGAVGTFSAFGGTNSLVSVDAMQEFRIQTSTYAPEYGRTPGAQISIVTRSGTDQFHGTLFDYFRNDALDANNWFNTAVTPHLPKAEERQNDFGGTFSGPIRKDKTFFFFSYEGLRLRLPQTALTTVPDLAARQNASAVMQPFLNAYPLPNGPGNPTTGVAQFNESYSTPATLDAYSIRLDHKINEKVSLFGRYNYSPSQIVQRNIAGTGDALSVAFRSRITIQTATIGSAWVLSPAATNDLRFNYSRTNPLTETVNDNFGGAVPLGNLPFPRPYTDQNARLLLGIFSLSNPYLLVGSEVQNLQRQFNLVDSISIQKGTHSLKFGGDFRRLSPVYAPFLYQQTAYFLALSSAETGALLASQTRSLSSATLLFRNLSFFAQDTWRPATRLAITYGIRWDFDSVPHSINGVAFPAVTGFNLNNLSTLALAPSGTPPYKATYGNFAPRLGFAYQLSQSQDWGTVARSGFGIFYDLASDQLGNLILNAGYPFSATSALSFGGTFPLNGAAAAPPPIIPPTASQGTLVAFDPNLRLPYSLEWNVALEQGLGAQQSASVTYVGAAGRRLIQTAYLFAPSANYGQAMVTSNGGVSSYNALQLELRRKLSAGLQILGSYTWSHSIDDGSAGSLGNGNGGANDLVVNPNSNRGPSDFDIRDQFSLGLTYDIPGPKHHVLARAIFDGWSTDNFVLARSAAPVNVYNSRWQLSLSDAATAVRPDVVPGTPLYLYGSQFAGGRALNRSAFVEPPTDASGNPLRQGDLGRNALRGFSAAQWDFAIHRDIPVHESVKLQFRAEMFNVLNHPNFAPPVSDLAQSNFGQSTELLGQFLGGGNLGGGGFNPLYQIGQPRSIQLALKLFF